MLSWASPFKRGILGSVQTKVTNVAHASAYIPAVDGMRAVSISLVLLSHFGFSFAPGSFRGTIFFFISGYLITGHILKEVDQTGRLSLPLFYLRRALRLYPALLVMVVVGGAVFLAIGGRVNGADILSAVFYFANIRDIVGGYDAGLPLTPHPYAVLWSLAVEEHYYLAFPLLALALARRRTAFVVTLVALVTVATLWRWHVATGCVDGSCAQYRIEHGTDTRIDSILYGAMLAALLASRFRTATLRLVSNWPAFTLGGALLLLGLVDRNQWFRETWRFTVQGVGLLLATGAVLHAASLHRVRGMLGWRPCLWVGRLSYSLYLWHWIVLCLAIPLLPARLAAPLVTLGTPSLQWIASVFLPLTALSMGLAAASYYGVERPMVAIRRHFGSNAVAEPLPGAVIRPLTADAHR